MINLENTELAEKEAVLNLKSKPKNEALARRFRNYAKHSSTGNPNSHRYQKNLELQVSNNQSVVEAPNDFYSAGSHKRMDMEPITFYNR